MTKREITSPDSYHGTYRADTTTSTGHEKNISATGESTYMKSIAERAAGHTTIERRNQLSKLCWFASTEAEQ